MKIKFYEILLISISVCIFTFCSSSSKETKVEVKQNQDTSYVFDKVPPEDIYKIEKPADNPPITSYIIQIGAFSTLENAKEFADFSRINLKKDIKVEYEENKKLYVVQIFPPYSNKKQAEAYRNELSYYEEYKDAWIITIQGKSK
ncbi:MAG: SPOR domain-containing protein [Ignavibacteriaceae bacterium]